ncbi:hypothetical protein Q5752_004643 [Cryptotrichosporon argae]
MPPAPTRRAVVSPIASASDIDAACTLFREYAATLPFDLAYQSFEAELAGLPAKYVPPMGGIWLARVAPGNLAPTPALPPRAAPAVADLQACLGSHGDIVGCVALRPLSSTTAELKRLFVRPAARASGAGSGLLDAALTFARAAGYERVVLDTLKDMHRAAALYRSRGFAEIAQYYDTPEVERTVFMGLELVQTA